MSNKLALLSKNVIGPANNIDLLAQANWRQTISNGHLLRDSHAMLMPVRRPKVLVTLAPPLTGELCGWPTLNKVPAHIISLWQATIP